MAKYKLNDEELNSVIGGTIPWEEGSENKKYHFICSNSKCKWSYNGKTTDAQFPQGGICPACGKQIVIDYEI